ncbi:MAG TPA: hypothetical protein VKY85_11560 [Candidatus Angelobacter sp.]|nr:hypothetical protein [Candidatus Angelobacter sp.]
MTSTKMTKISRSQTQRRRFLRILGMVGIGFAFLLAPLQRVMSQETQSNAASLLPIREPIQVTIKNTTDMTLSNGRETTFTLEMKDANGVLVVNQCYYRLVDMPDSYVVTATIKSSRFSGGTSLGKIPDLTRTVTRTLNGTKGTGQGNARMDTVEATTVQPSGVINHDGPLTIPVHLDLGPLSNLSLQEQFNWFLAHNKLNAQSSIAQAGSISNPGCVLFCVAVCGEFVFFPPEYFLCLAVCLMEANCFE